MRSLRRSGWASCLPGYDADFILVDRDLYKCPAQGLLYTHVQGVYVGGQESFAGDTKAQ